MKKYVSLLLAVVFIFSAVPLSGVDIIGKNINWNLFEIKSEAASSSGLEFRLNDDENSYYVYSGSNAKGDIIIPSEYRGLPVTRIGEYAFCSIPCYAIEPNTNITSAVIPDSVIEIGYGAFAKCTKLLDVTLSENLIAIGYYAFYECDSLSQITIPDSVETIGYCAFNCCDGLTSVTIGSGVKTIAGSAFGGGHTSIDGMSGTYFNSNIKKVYISDIVNWCGIEFEALGSNPLYYAQNETSLYLNGEPVKNLVIPDGVKSIGNYAFMNCKGITSVSFHEGLKIIGDYAFYGCKNITKATIPDSVSSIGNDCFHSNTVLTVSCQSPFAGEFKTTHNYSKKWTVDKAATAKAAGSKSHHCIDCGKKTDVTAIKRLKPGVTKLKKVTNDLKGVKITWSAVSGADNYVIYRKSGSSEYKAIKTVSGKTTSYVDTTAKSGTKYTYTVKAKNSSGSGSYNKTGLSKLYLAAPKKITITNKATGIKVTWSKVTGAKGYEVLRMNSSGKWSKVATIKKQSTVSYTDTKVSNGAYYCYTVVPYNGKTKSAEAVTGQLKYLTAPEITKIKSTVDGIYLKWTKNSKADYYVVYRKEGNGKYSKYATTYYNDGYDIGVRGKKYTYYVEACSDGFQSSHKNTKSCTDKYY